MPTLSPLYISTGYERVGHGHERLPDVATCSYAAAMKSGDCSTRGGRRDGGRGGRGSGRVDSSREQKHKDSAAAPGNGRRRRSRGIDPGAFELQLEEQRQRQQQRREGGNGGGERGEDNGGGSAIGEQRTSSVKSGPHNTTPPSISAPSSSDQQRSEQRRPQSLIRGFQYDEARGRYFPTSSPFFSSSSSSEPFRPPKNLRGASSLSTLPASASAFSSLSTSSFSKGAPFVCVNFTRRLREREWRHGQQQLHMGSLHRLLHLSTSTDLGQEGTLEDIDVAGGGVVTGARNGMLHVSALPLSSDEFPRRWPILSFHSSVVRVRWRVGRQGELPCLLAVATMGTAAGKAAVTVCKLQGESSEEGIGHGEGGGSDGGQGGRRGWMGSERLIREDRFPLDARDVWGVEWEPGQGRRLLPCLSHGPLLVVDVEARRQLRHSFRLPSDCFAACWSTGGESSNGSSNSSSSEAEEGVFLGLRNGQVRFVDLRAPTGIAQPLTTMGSVVDQIEMLPNGRGLLVSDRLGALRLLDLRLVSSLPGAGAAGAAGGLASTRTTTAYLRDFPAPRMSNTPASTGFVLDRVDGSLVLTLTTRGQLRTYDLNAPQREEEWKDGRRTHVCVADMLPLLSSGFVNDAALTIPATTGAAAPPRFFLARRWAGEGWDVSGRGREESGSLIGNGIVDVWPSKLVCGDRTSGRIRQLRLQRESCGREKEG